MTTLECKNCKGKGHVLSGAAALCMTVFSVVLVPLERNDPNGVTREKCQKCKGSGYIKIPS
jgi:DnaJ-class molecular chaperone